MGWVIQQVCDGASARWSGAGVSKEYPLKKMFRDARASLIEDGTNEVLSLTGARHILAEAAGGNGGSRNA